MKKFFLNPSLKKQFRYMLAVLLICFSTQALASHFRFGLVTATRLSETSTTVTYRINVSTSWRLGTAPGTTVFSISGGNSGSFSVGMTNVTDPSGGWTNSTGTAVITLNKSATLTRLTSTSCCKISDLINNNDSNWDIYIVLNTNAPGSSPVSTSAAIINMPVNAPAATAQVAASDPDPGSTLTYGIPNLVSGNLGGQTEPAGWSINSTGLMTFNTVGKSVGQLYNAMVTVTDNNNNQIFLDLIIKMVGPSTPPVFDYSVTPLSGTVFNVIAGQTLTFPIRATDADAGSSVSFSVSGLNSFITTSNFSSAPLPATGNPAQTTFSYTPAVAQSGTQTVLNFIATDNVGVQATSSVTINVTAQPAPVFIAPTPAQGTIRSILTGVNHTDNIVASSSLGSNVSIAFATLPGAATTTPAVPTAGANPGSTTMNWIPTPSQFGQHTLSYTATISSTPTIFSVRSYDLIVNTLPVFTSTPVTAATDCETYSYTITATDDDIPFGDLVEIVSQGTLPSWLTLESTGNGTAVLTGNPTSADIGTYTITLVAEDTYHHNYDDVVQTFVITVTPCCTPPVISCPGDITVSNAPGKCGATVCYPNPEVTATCAPATPAGYHFLTSIGNHYYYQSDDQSNYTTAANNANAAGGHLAVITSAAENSAIAATGAGYAWIGGDDEGSEGSFHWSDCEAYTYSNFCSGEPNGGTFENHLEFETGGCWNDLNIGAFRYSIIEVEGARVVRTGLPSNSFFPVGTTTISYVATDAAGNTTDCSFNITVNDTEPPVLNNVPDDMTVQCDAVPAPAEVTASDNCPDVGAVILTSTVTQGSCANNYSITHTWSVTDAHGLITQRSQVITVVDNTAPTFTRPADKILFKDAYCNVDTSPNGAAGDVTDEHDNCATGLNATYTDQVIPGCQGSFTIKRTWSLNDGCGNAAANQVQTIIVKDNKAPTFTKPADITIPYTSTCGYNASLAATGDVINEADNCSTGLQATSSDVITRCGNNTVITRTWHLVDNCGNAAADQVQTITVTDNKTDYIIYATNEAKFGEYNTINGDVGVTAVNGKAEFKKYDVLDPRHVYARNINTQSPSSVSFKHFVPATGGPNPPFYMYGGGGLSGNYTQTVSGAVPAGNYKELKIKGGLTVTINGSNYGKITIEEGADVTFTSGSIDMEELSVGKGKNSVYTTNVHFTSCAGVRIKDKVTIEEDCRVNVNGPKVNFYMADNRRDEEKFTVKGDNTWVTLNILIPNGKLKVNGGNNYAIMTGFFIVEKLESEGKYVTWNPYGCTTPSFSAIPPIAAKVSEEVPQLNAAIDVTAGPNPSRTSFRLMISGIDHSKSVLIKIRDISGRVMSTERTVISKAGWINVGSGLKAGSYFAEISQGNERKLIKLVKLD